MIAHDSSTFWRTRRKEPVIRQLMGTQTYLTLFTVLLRNDTIDSSRSSKGSDNVEDVHEQQAAPPTGVHVWASNSTRPMSVAACLVRAHLLWRHVQVEWD